MKLEPECVGCFFNQIMKALSLLNKEIKKEEMLDAQNKFMEYLLSIDVKSLEAPLIGKKAYEIIAEALECSDPYKDLKKTTNKLALENYERIKDEILDTNEPLFYAIIAAALANTVDFASQHKIELVHKIKNFDPERLVINDYDKFKKLISKARNLLIIGDNSGEIVFDMLLIEILKMNYPKLKIIYAVRSTPIINDATVEDAKFIGLDKLVEVIESSPTPGVNLETATEDFKRWFYKNNTIILSKGQGNFESLYDNDVSGLKLFHLFMAKCNLMERLLKVKIGNLIFMKKRKMINH